MKLLAALRGLKNLQKLVLHRISIGSDDLARLIYKQIQRALDVSRDSS